MVKSIARLGPLAGTLVFALVVIPGTAPAALIVAYDTDNPNGSNPAAPDLPAAESLAATTALSLSRGSGLTARTGASFNSGSWASASLADAIADGNFLTWGWSSSPPLQLSALDLRYSRSTSGPAELVVQLAVNGGTFSTIFSDAAVSTAGETQLGIDLSAFDGITSAVFRLVAFNTTSNTGTLSIGNFQSSPDRGIAVSGHLSSAAAPEPATATVLGLGTSLIGILRRRGAPRRACPRKESSAAKRINLCAGRSRHTWFPGRQPSPRGPVPGLGRSVSCRRMGTARRWAPDR
jgi:hypothetical protein